MRWVLAVFLAWQVSYTLFPNALTTPNPSAPALGFLVFVGEAAILVVVQLYRYRRGSSPLQRPQTKRGGFGFSGPITVYVVWVVPSLLFPRAPFPRSPLLVCFSCL